MADLNVSVILRAVDRLSGPLRQVIGGVRQTGSAAEVAQRRLDDVGRTQGTVDGFRRLKTETAQAAQSLKEAQDKVGALAREMRQAEKPSAALRKEFEAAKREAARLKGSHQQLQQRTEEARRSLQQAGVSTRDLARHQRELTREATAAAEAIERQRQRMERLERIQQRSARAHEQLGKTMQLAGHTSMVAGAAGNVGQQALGMVNDVLGSLRQVEKARGELATVGVQDLDLIVARGREMQRSVAGVTAASFVAAAYDIKSGISTLSDEGVAAMTAAAAVTAKATKAQTEQMTSLFATSYGIFKRQFADMEDGAFGDMFGSTLAAAVQQFKTDGSKMQQAIESSGAGATNLGMRMQEQLAILGQLGMTMSGGESGTALAAFARSAAKAHEEFGKLSEEGDNPIQVRILDENGMLRQMPDILADVKERYGDTLDAFEKAEIQKAFGSDEALKIIDGLWGQEEALRAGTAALDKAGSAGLTFAQRMALLADNNFDSRMVLAAQRFDDFKQSVGAAVVPIIDKLLPVFDRVLNGLSGWIERNPALAMTIGGVAVGVAVLGIGLAGLFSILGAAIGGFGMFRFAIQMATGRLAIMSAANTTAAGSTGLLSRAMAAAGGGIRGAAGMVASFGRGALGLAGRAIPAVIGGLRALTVALMTNPIGLIVGGIALAAGLIIANWDTVGPWFGRMWEGVKSLFSSAWETIKGILSWTPLGMIISNWEPISSAFGVVFDGVKATVGGAVDWIGERLQGILDFAGAVVDRVTGAVGWVADKLGLGDEEAGSAATVAAAPSPVVAASEEAQAAVRPRPQFIGVASAAPPAGGATPAQAAGGTPSTTINAPITINGIVDREALIKDALSQFERKLRSELRGALYDNN